jgi:hypothetical protein
MLAMAVLLSLIGASTNVAYFFVEEYGISPSFLMRREASFRVYGSSILMQCLLRRDWITSRGVGQGDKFKPSDMTGGCLALT